MNNPKLTNRFNFEVVEEGGNKHMTRKNIRVVMKNGKLKYKHIRELFDVLITSGIDSSKITVAGMGPTNYFTFKSMQVKEMDEYFDEEKYFKNRVQDSAKFDGFEFCDFIVR